VAAVANDIEVRLPAIDERPDPEIAREAVKEMASANTVARVVLRPAGETFEAGKMLTGVKAPVRCFVPAHAVG
jgi:hypothetical protein